MNKNNKRSSTEDKCGPGSDLRPTNIPPFLVKLQDMVDDPKSDNLISWSPFGTKFTIHNKSEF